MASEEASNFHRRIARLEQLSILLRGLRNEHTQLQIIQVQQKATIYNDNMHVSHGERQGIASAQTAQVATELLQVKGQIEVLEEEQRFLEFAIRWVEED